MKGKILCVCLIQSSALVQKAKCLDGIFIFQVFEVVEFGYDSNVMMTAALMVSGFHDQNITEIGHAGIT